MELMVDIKSLVRGKVSINTSNSERNWYEIGTKVCFVQGCPNQAVLTWE